MQFDASPLNVTGLLLVALAVSVMVFLSKKRLDSNLPLLFYLGVLLYGNMTGRHINVYLFTGGLAFALMLRFEFMNAFFTKAVMALEMLAVMAIAWTYISVAFGLRLYW
jgi:hypothetical protein